MTELSTNNPFQITSPEDLTAEEAEYLFVDVFTDFQKIIDPGHVFLVGPRGAGKSMMFRYLMPDCQCIAKNCKLESLPFLGVYVPLKNTNFALAELKRLEHRHASDILNEHIMVTHFCVKIFETLAKSDLYPLCDDSINAVKNFYNDTFISVLFKATHCIDDRYKLGEVETIADIFSKLSDVSEMLYNDAFSYAKKLAFRTDIIPYDGPLCDYLSFLLPILNALSKLPGFPRGSIYLLIDDAHWLTETQARVLNSWVATRTSRSVSLKISTQYNYKTYYTASGATIDTPHDFAEIDVATIYTGNNKSKYRSRIADIVKKRLAMFGINDVSAEEFFPEDKEQEAEINRLGERYNARHDSGDGKGFYRTDDALRYARPDYIKSLAGASKSSSKYSYAGFNQLVHLSSGIVRHFIHPAHLMYAATKSQPGSEELIKFIPPSIQSDIMREEANNFLFSDLEKMEKEGHEEAPPKEDINKLSNLIHGLGGLFRQVLLSNRSERRVFSIAFSDQPTQEVKRILKLGIRLGYFHTSTIGRKDSKSGGRTRLYVLNRRLAPIWTLDPTGFAGYLFLKSGLIEEALEQPLALLRRLSNSGIPDDTEVVQLELF